MFNIQTLKEKKKIIYLIVIVGLVVFAILVLRFFTFPVEKFEKLKPPAIKEEKTMEEIIRDLTAPATTSVSTVSEKVIKNLTAPVKNQHPEVSEEIIKNLTAPENK